MITADKNWKTEQLKPLRKEKGNRGPERSRHGEEKGTRGMP